MVRNMPSKDTAQLHLRPPRTVINRLDELAKEYRKDSPNQVAVEILRDYADLWAAAEQTKRDTIIRQQEAVTRAIQAESLRQPLHEAVAEQKRTEGKRHRK